MSLGFNFKANPRGKKKAPAEIAEILGQFAGFSSMCWEPKPTGVFNSALASLGVDNASILIEEYYRSKFNG